MTGTEHTSHQERSRGIQDAAAKLAGSRELLEEAILEARSAGMPLREIAKYAQMSHEQVRRLTQ